jgi:hypothetical protein
MVEIGIRRREKEEQTIPAPIGRRLFYTNGFVLHPSTEFQGLLVYVQGLFGLVHWSADDVSDEAFFAAPGGGVLIPITNAVHFKGQVDFFLPNWDGYSDNLVRVFLGVNFKLGKK